MTTYLRNASTSAYVDVSRTTASPAKLLCLLWDRLLLDLERADEALLAGKLAHTELRHAQDIVMELLATLDTSAWSGAQGLANLYTYLHTQLVTANVKRDRAIVAECRGIVAPLRDAWHAAAAGAPDEPVLSTHVGGTTATPAGARLPMTPLSA